MSIINILLQLINQFPVIFVILLLKVLGVLSFAHIIVIYVGYCIYVQYTSKTYLYYTKSVKNEKILSMCPNLSNPNFKPYFFFPFAFQQLAMTLTTILIQDKSKLNFREQKINKYGLTLYWPYFSDFEEISDPNDPVDYLSRKMLQLISEDSTNAIRKKTTLIEGEVTDNIIVSPDKIAIQNLKKDFYQNYRIIEEISMNNYLVEDIKLGDVNGQKCARIIDKSVNKNKILMSDRIISTLVKLSHPNLIKIIEILEDDKYFYVIYDYCPGKDLFNYFYTNRSNMTEDLIRKALTQILAALGYLHRSGVIYKNLIPSKVLVYNKEFDPNDIQIKLGDLINNTEIFSKKNFIYHGFDNIIQDPLFIAPEFLEKKYNQKVDIWGVGMLAYLLFVGAPPFHGPKHKILYSIANENIEYPPDLEPNKKSLLQKMLAKNPNERYDADTLLKEEYFHQDLDESGVEEKSGKGFLNVVNSISTFTVGKNLRKSAMSYIIARKLYNENDQKLRKIFEALDSDHNGYIDKKELLKEYNKYFPGTTKKQLRVINNFLETADVDNNGKIDYAEFLTAMNLGNKEISENTLREVFNYYDHDKNGVIEAKDIKEIFEDTGLSDKEIHDLIDEVDLNEDRSLSFQEFYKLITAAI